MEFGRQGSEVRILSLRPNLYACLPVTSVARYSEDMGNTSGANDFSSTGSSIFVFLVEKPESFHYPVFREVQETATPEVTSLSLHMIYNRAISL